MATHEEIEQMLSDLEHAEQSGNRDINGENYYRDALKKHEEKCTCPLDQSKKEHWDFVIDLLMDLNFVEQGADFDFGVSYHDKLIEILKEAITKWDHRTHHQFLETVTLTE